MVELTRDLIAELKPVDTPTFATLGDLVPERRGHGFTTKPLVCIGHGLRSDRRHRADRRRFALHIPATRMPTRQLPSEIRTTSTSTGTKAEHRGHPGSRRRQRGYGSFWGEVNSNIHKGLGCDASSRTAACVTCPTIAEGFQMLADRVGPSHAFVHVVDYSRPVTVAECESPTVTSSTPINTVLW